MTQIFRLPRKLLSAGTACALLLLLLATGEAWGQSNLPAAPTIDSVTAGDGLLTAAWTAPSNASGISAYDLRHIETSADETVEANWTLVEDVWTSGAGGLEHTIFELDNSVSYDVQVRGVNSSGDGEWSTTSTGIPMDHGDNRASATDLGLNAAMIGSIDSSNDEDYFQIVLSEASGIFVYTTSYITGFLPTTGELQNSSGVVVTSDDGDTQFRQHGQQLFLWDGLEAGTYYVKVSASDTGFYTLHTQTIKETTAKENASDLSLNGFADGILEPGATDEDYFKIELFQTTDMMIRVSRANSEMDTEGTLLDSDDKVIAVHDDSFLEGDLRRHFLIREQLDAGVYYLRVRSSPGGTYEICESYRGVGTFCVDKIDKEPSTEAGPYIVHAEGVTAPGSSTGSASLLTLGENAVAGGRIDGTGDADYFKITVSGPTHVKVQVVSATLETDGELLDTSRRPVGTLQSDLDIIPGALGFILYGSLDAGTSYVKVTAGDSSEYGPYAIVASEDTTYTQLWDHCSALFTNYNDPLYGCQWHLNNTGQNTGSAAGTVGEDINVEEVWDDGNLGSGVNIALVDNGLNYAHEDLTDNVDRSRNHDYTGGGDVFHRYLTHGTRMAGIIGARDNDLGVRGVAPRATMYVYNAIRYPTFFNIADAMSRDLADTWVSNNSWAQVNTPAPKLAPRIWELAMDAGVSTGFGGKGIFYSFSGGNGGRSDVGDYSNLSEINNYYAVTAVCATNDLGQRADYSELGPNLWLCAPSSDSKLSRQSITTTQNFNRYDAGTGGASSAVAMVSGVAALVRNANPALTWRDVKLILAGSARKNDPTDSGWEAGALKYGSTTDSYSFNHQYGFGVVDAKAAVDLVDGWTPLPPLQKDTAASAHDLDLSIPDSNSRVSDTVTVGSSVSFVEFVEVNVVFDHLSFRDLEVDLVSPSNRVSVLSVPYESDEKYPLTSSYRLGSARHLGEDAEGNWTLRITDTVTGTQGALNSWSLTIYGHGEALSSPTLTSVSPGSSSLTIAWDAPDDTSGITAYDVRHIVSSATDKADDKWTVVDSAWTTGSGAWERTVSGLTDGTGYDLQVRAVVAGVDGDWSDTATGTPGTAAATVPSISALRRDDRAVVVSWSAPTSTTLTVKAYDVRHIRNDAANKADASWALVDDAWTSDSGDLEYTITGQENGVMYDVQVRALNSDDMAGAWSPTFSTTPSDYGDALDSATTLVLDTTSSGRIAPLGHNRFWGVLEAGGEDDYFKFELTRQQVSSGVGVWIYTSSDIDMVGDLLDSDGLPIDSVDDGHVDPNPLDFLIWRTLEAGTYYVKVSGYQAAQGPYVFSIRTFADTTSRGDAAELALDGSALGLLDPDGEEDYFKLDLSEDTGVILRSSGFPDLVGELQNSFGGLVSLNDDGYLPYDRYQFLIHESLEKGTYYLKVKGFDSFFGEVGPYRVFATAVKEPGSSTTAADPLPLGEAAGGYIDPLDDEDYFSITISESTFVMVRILSDYLDPAGLLLDINAMAVQPDIAQAGFGSFTIRDQLDAGTYYIKVTGDGVLGGRYTIMVIEEVEYARLQERCSDSSSTGINDSLYGCQWHLNNTGQFRGGARQDIRVEEVWSANILGTGITVAVVDDGMHYAHEDLTDNVKESMNYDYLGENEIYSPRDSHGTAVAGIIAAKNNSIGMRGVAPEATIYGYNLFVDSTDQNEGDAMSRNAEDTAISNNSWGPADFGYPEFTNSFWIEGIEKGITDGFDGKGTFYAWAAGNGGRWDDYSNLDEYANYYGVTAACAVNHTDVRSSFSEPGSNLWVCAPSNESIEPRMPGIATTDNGNRYRGDFGGTSAATPIVSGVAALVRSAKNSLTWRDVKLILASSARKNDPTDSGWEAGALKYGTTTERYEFNHEYGFGVVDANAAVDLARTWTNAPAFRKTTKSSGEINLTIPDVAATPPGPTVTSSLKLPLYVEFIEFIEIKAHFDHPSFRDLDVELVSPSGVVSKLVPPSDFANYINAPLTAQFRFGSAKHLGEGSAGTWTLRVADHVRGVQGTLKSWELTAYGHGYLPGAADVDEITPNQRSLTVDWKEPVDSGESAVISYDLRYIRSDASDKSDDQWMVEEDVGTPGGTLSHTITGLVRGVQYYVQIRAGNSRGFGPWSDTASATPPVIGPFAPAIASITPGAAALAVAWTVPTDTGGDDPTSYDLRYIETGASDKADDKWTVRDSAWTSGALRYTVSSLTNGTEYDVQVRAANSIGDGLWSDTRTGTPRLGDVPVTLLWGQASFTADEGAGRLTLQAIATTTIDEVPASDFSFDATVATSDGSATQPADYAELRDTVTFNAGDFTRQEVNGQQRYRAIKEFTIAIVEDTIDESNEGFSVTLDYVNSPLPHLQGGNSTASIGITDNDEVPVTLSWEQTVVSVDEGAGTVMLRAMSTTTEDKAPESDFSFQTTVSTSDGTASEADDYTRLFETVTFSHTDFRRATVDGQRRYHSEKQVVISILDDIEDEPDKDFSVTLAYSNPTLVHLQGGPATATVTIGDNDHVPVNIVWKDTTVTVDEDAGTVTLEAAVVTTKDKAPESGFSFGVTVTTGDGSAEQNVDYRRLSTTATFRQADFSRGTLNGQARYGATKEFTISIREDTLDEPEETFTVTVSYSDPSQPHLQGGSSTATVYIGDNDDPPVTVVADAATADEGDSSITFTLQRDRVADIPLTVDVQITETGDMLATSQPTHATFNPTSNTAPLQIGLVDDPDDETDSVVTVQIVAGATYRLGSPASAQTTVHDNEHVPVTLAWEKIAVTVNEGSGTASLRAMSDTTEDKRPEAGFSFETSIYTSNGTAIQTEDYATLSETVVFQQSDFSPTTINGQRRYRAIKQVSLSIVDDTMDEPDEDFRVTLAYSGPTAPHLQGGPANVDMTITDNDHVPVTIEWEQPTLQADEDAGTMTLKALTTTTKDKAPERGFSFGVMASTTDGSAAKNADYREHSRSATFRQADFIRENVRGQMLYRASKEFTITISGDTADEEEESFIAILAYSNPSLPYLQGGSSAATITITDNDHVPVFLSWESDTATSEEPLASNGTRNASLTAIVTTTKDKMPETGFSFDFTVNTADGTATQPDDYQQLSETLTFSRSDFSQPTEGPRRYEARKVIDVPIAYDGQDELNETFTVALAYASLGPPYLEGGRAAGTVTITDDRSTTVNLRPRLQSVPPPSIQRSQTLTYNYILRNAGPATSTDPILKTTLGPGTSFVSVTPTDKCSHSGSSRGGVVTCSFDSLSAGSPQTGQIVVNVTEEADADIMILFVASSNELDNDPSSNSYSFFTELVAPPQKVTNLSSPRRGIDFIELSWPKPADNGSPITAYVLERKEVNGSHSAVNPAPAARTFAYLDQQVTTGTTYVYRIRAINEDGEAEWSDDVTATAEQRRVITGSGGGGGGAGGGGGTPANRPPRVEGPDRPDYAENGTHAVATYTADDPEDDGISWSMDGRDSRLMEISQAGELRFKEPPDYEKPVDSRFDNTYEVTLRATDDGSPPDDDIHRVRVTVTNVNEVGPIVGQAEIEVVENFTEPIAQYQAEDPERDAITWSLSGPDASFFEIDLDGHLSPVKALDFEAKDSADGTSIYKVTVTVTDDRQPAASATLDVAVTVSDVEEAPKSPLCAWVLFILEWATPENSDSLGTQSNLLVWLRNVLTLWLYRACA